MEKNHHQLPLLLGAGFTTRITHQCSRGLVPVLWVPLLVLKELESLSPEEAAHQKAVVETLLQ